MKKNHLSALLFVLILFVSLISKATHNRSGEILYKRLPPFTNTNYTYSITVVKYFDDGSLIADRCADTVYFGDGTKGIAPRINGISGSCCATSSCGVLISTASGYRVKMSMYSIVHTYPDTGSYVIRSADPNRTSGIYNIPNSGNTVFYIESVMNLTPFMGMNSSPVLTRAPIDRGVTSSCFYHNPCAFDPDGDSLSYELIQCKDGTGQSVAGYFYPPVSGGGNLGIDAVTGLISWCNPQVQGNFQIAFLVKEWRKFDCYNYQQIGYVERDMEIIVGAGTSTYNFSASGFRDTCVVAGSVLNFSANAGISPVASLNGTFWTNLGFLKDNTLAAISFTNVSNISAGTWSSATQWTPACSDVLGKPQIFYCAFFVGGSNQVVNYSQMRVKVIPPAPKITSVQIATSKVTLQWQAPSICGSGITAYKIYRKFGANSWIHAPCETGVPASSGFSLIGFTWYNVTSFVDNDLWTIPNGSLAYYMVTTVMNETHVTGEYVTGRCTESYADSAKVVTLIVGLNENKLENSVKVFPNPFNDNVEIQFKGSDYSSVETALYSVDGKLLREQNYQTIQNNILIDTRDLSPGVYFLKLKSKDETANFKLIKE